MNKIDLSPHFQPRIDYDDKKLPTRVWVSAEKNIGLDLLLQAIAELLTKHIVHCQVILQPHQGQLRAKLYDLGVIQSEKTNEDGTALLELKRFFSGLMR